MVFAFRSALLLWLTAVMRGIVEILLHRFSM